jgi:hypothetical protein
LTPYSFSIQKCGEKDCAVCKPISTPEGEIRNIVMQRQPTPIQDPSRPGHFYPRVKALSKFKDDPASLLNLFDLPSKNPKSTSKSQEKERKAQRSVRNSVACWECGKQRCLFSKKKIDDNSIIKKLQI